MANIQNGRLPDAMLTYLDWPEAATERLRPDAAASIDRLAVAFHAAFGYALHITDSYRDYARQVQSKQVFGPMAATPGTSNHGLGIALDVGSGVAQDGSPTHLWMEANAGRFGWVNPPWAVNFNPGDGGHEPWHWEYHPEFDTAPTDPTPAPIPEVPDMDDNDKRILNEANQNAFNAYTTALGTQAEVRSDAVARLYREILHREPNPAEVAGQVAAIASGTTSLDAIRWAFSTLPAGS